MEDIFGDHEHSLINHKFDPYVFTTGNKFYRAGTDECQDQGNGASAPWGWSQFEYTTVEIKSLICISVYDQAICGSLYGPFEEELFDPQLFIEHNPYFPVDCDGDSYYINMPEGEEWLYSELLEFNAIAPESFVLDYININENATFIIDNTPIYMSEGGVINMYPSSTLILDNAFLTSCDLSKFWEGIRFIGGAENDYTIEIKNNSIIENSEIGIYSNQEMQAGSSIVINGNSTFRNNKTAIMFEDIYGLPNSGLLYLDIDDVNFINNNYAIQFKNLGFFRFSITNSTFTDNPVGMFMYDPGLDGFTPSVLDNCDFISSEEKNNCRNGIVANGLGELDINNCNFIDTWYEGVRLSNSNNVNFKNCEFKGNDWIGLAIEKSKKISVEECDFTDIAYEGINAYSECELIVENHNIFTDCRKGILAFNSNLEVSGYNEFHECKLGIATMASEDGVSYAKITDGNYFSYCIDAIDLSGMDGLERSEVSDNVFNNCTDGISLGGYNYFEISDNSFYGNDNPVFATATGYENNEILCNYMDMSSEIGIELKDNNRFTSFLGNYFSYGGMDDILINGNVNPTIGDETHPANNYFSDGSGDIKIADNNNTQAFLYYLTPDGDPQANPDNLEADDIPQSWEERTEDIYFQPNCVIPPGTIETNFSDWWQYYCTLLAEYEENKSWAVYFRIKHLEEKLKRQLYYLCYEIGLDYRTMLEIMMRYCENFFSQKIMFYMFLHYDDCEKADSMLNVIEFTLREPIGETKMDSLERASKESFVNINRIGVKYHCDSTRVDTFIKSDTLFKFTEGELTTLYEETYKGIPESAYAKALYYIGTGEILMFERSERSITPRSMPEETISKIEETDIFIYPNPANDKLYIKCKTAKIDGEIIIYNIYGKKVIDKSMNTINEDVDVSNLSAGVYLLSIINKSGETIITEKIVISKK